MSAPGRGVLPAVPGPGLAPDDDLAGRLGIAAQRLAHAVRVHATRDDLTPSRLAVLAILATWGPLRVSDLAARARIAIPTVSKAVDMAVRRGWARRHTDPADQRVCLIGLSDQGAAVLTAARRRSASRLAADIARLRPADVAALRAALPVLELLAEHTSPGPAGDAPAAP